MDKTQTQEQKKGYDPFAIRRCVRHDFTTADGVQVFKTKSFTDRADDSDRYRPAVDLTTGHVDCQCPHFQYRLARHNPTVWSNPEYLCKHIQRALANLERRGELPQQNGQHGPACIHCGALEAEFEVCDERGQALPGQFICASCIEARTDDLSDAAPATPEPAPRPQMTPEQIERALALANEF